MLVFSAIDDDQMLSSTAKLADSYGQCLIVSKDCCSCMSAA